MAYMKQTKGKQKYNPPIWIAEALSILKPPEKISVSEFSDKNRVLGSKNAEPGPWQTSRTPYLKVIMDTYNDPDVEDVGFLKPTQVGGTECLNNMLGYAVSQEGASNLVILPTTDLADYMTKKGVPFRDAYKLVGQIVALCIDKKWTLDNMPFEEYKKLSDVFAEDLYEEISLETCVKRRISMGGTSPDSVRAQVSYVEEFLKNA